MFDMSPVVDTCYEVMCEDGRWTVFSYVTYANGRRIRNWCAQADSIEEAYARKRQLEAATRA